MACSNAYLQGEYSVVKQPVEGHLLELEWRALENKVHPEFFLSWTWVSTWLESYEPNVSVLKVFKKDNLIGLALVTSSKASRHTVMSFNSLQFQETGDSVKDQIWIEYNGILASSAVQSVVWELVLNSVPRLYPANDELVLGAIDKKCRDLLVRLDTSFGIHEIWRSYGYGVDLEKLRSANQAYLSSLSKNTRHQINRALRLYQNRGTLRLLKADSLEESLDYFKLMAPLHIKRWGNKAGESGFSNKYFVQFHENLIKKAYPENLIDLLKVDLDGVALAYLYCFKWLGKIYFYLIASKQESDNKLKPGLVAHALAIEHYLQAGFSYYDFMGGNERYKGSLADENNQFFRIRFSKKNWKHTVESSLRRVKQYITKGRR